MYQVGIVPLASSQTCRQAPKVPRLARDKYEQESPPDASTLSLTTQKDVRI